MKNFITKGVRHIRWEVYKFLMVKPKTFLRLGTLLEKPLTLYSSRWLKFVLNHHLPKSEAIFMKTGILPVADHYYQPLINPKKHLTKSLRDDRELPGLNMNVEEQLRLLHEFNYNEELLQLPIKKEKDYQFYYDNGWYASGDAEYLYNIVRYFKPKKIIEIGSGFSTLMVTEALSKNKREGVEYSCEHICIEPYEQPWLEQAPLRVIRKKIEDIEKSFIQSLQKNDILFIDSSHIIRPQGDVLFEFLELLPILNSGVIIHVHDIFTPKDYPDEWVYEHRLWNEQYLLEAFLSFNSAFKVIGALNYLAHNHTQAFSDKCPVFAKQQGREPGGFWMIKK